MAKEKLATVRISLWVTEDAAALLDQLAPSPNKRGRYMSDLIRRAAQEAGLVDSPAPTTLDLAALQLQLKAAQHQLQQVQAHYESLQSRVDAAMDTRRGRKTGESESDSPSL